MCLPSQTISGDGVERNAELRSDGDEGELGRLAATISIAPLPLSRSRRDPLASLDSPLAGGTRPRVAPPVIARHPLARVAPIMDDHPTDRELLRHQAAELAELRELLAAVSSALERLNADEPDAARQRLLRAHASRLRRRLSQA